MKRIVSVSIGSSSRNHHVFADICGEKFSIQRIGTDGDINKAIQLIEELDGKVDVFGMGGIDLYLHGRNGRKYILKSAIPIAKAAKKTPIVDGSGLKNTLERSVVRYVNDYCDIPMNEKKVLLVCGMDRFGMAETFCEYGSVMTFGDLIFAIGIPIPIHKLRNLHRIAYVLMPIISRLPFKLLYPTGAGQEEITQKFSRYYNEAEIIAGDYLYIKKYLPLDLKGKVIITNTVTVDDIRLLKERNLKTLVTSTPELDGRSFGTNVMEAVLVCLSGRRPEELTSVMYDELLVKAGFQHRVEYLN